MLTELGLLSHLFIASRQICLGKGREGKVSDLAVPREIEQIERMN